MAGGGGPVAFQPGGHHPRRKEATFNELSATIVMLAPNARPVYYLAICSNFITGPWVSGQVNIATQLTAEAPSGTTILSVEGGPSKQKQYKVTAGGGTNPLTVTPSIATTPVSGTTVHPLWGVSAHLKDWDALAYFTMNAKRADGTPVIQARGTGPVVLLGNSWFVAGGAAIAASIEAKHPGAAVPNQGTNGQTSNQIIDRFDADVPSNASYVIINEPGVHDTKAGALTTPERPSVSIGVNALRGTVDARENIAIGNAAMLNNLSSHGNVAIGANSMPGLPSGNGANIALGTVSLFFATTASRNIAIGQAAGFQPGGA